MPILEVVLRQLKHSGITRVTMAVGHLAELLQAFFGNGDRLGLQIDYSMEDRPLGTVGPLTLIPGLRDERTFLMMNGDLLTTLDYQELIRQHRARGAAATIATYRREVRIDFGVIETGTDNLLSGYVEKPCFNYNVSMGVYCFDSSVLDFLKHGEHRDFPDLIKDLIAAGRRTWQRTHSTVIGSTLAVPMTMPARWKNSTRAEPNFFRMDRRHELDSAAV